MWETPGPYVGQKQHAAGSHKHCAIVVQNPDFVCVTVLTCPHCLQGELLPYCELWVGPLVSEQDPLMELAAACDAHPKCKAFTYSLYVQNSRSAIIGRLKGAAGPTNFYDSTDFLRFAFIKD
jgi:hypothetical protein